ncbi:MAG: DUF4317 domain-containing protein [Eubacteriales bacterium]|nr:DUF4317 domain-containing protein [Eubacteriales bacterium]
MNKKDQAELKKQFNRKNKCISRICGCYFDIDGNKRLTYGSSFLNIPEEEDIKYMKILSTVIGGRLGKLLHNCAYDTREEMHGDMHRLLTGLRDSELKDEGLLEVFYDRMIEKLPKEGNYLILLAYGMYDVPKKGDDGFLQRDESESVYTYLVCAVCPVNLSDGALSYNEESNAIESRFRDWVVEMPERGFLFPAFTDRAPDIHTLMYYAKKGEKLTDSFLTETFGLETPAPDKEERENFQQLVTGVSREEGMSIDVANAIQNELALAIEAHKDDAAPFELDKHEVKNVLERSGVDVSACSEFDELYRDCCKDRPLTAENITSGKKLDIRIRDIRVSVPRESADYIETRIIDGKKCLVITADEDMEVNGVPVEIREE